MKNPLLHFFVLFSFIITTACGSSGGNLSDDLSAGESSEESVSAYPGEKTYNFSQNMIDHIEFLQEHFDTYITDTPEDYQNTIKTLFSIAHSNFTEVQNSISELQQGNSTQITQNFMGEYGVPETLTLTVKDLETLDQILVQNLSLQTTHTVSTNSKLVYSKKNFLAYATDETSITSSEQYEKNLRENLSQFIKINGLASEENLDDLIEKTYDYSSEFEINARYNIDQDFLNPFVNPNNIAAIYSNINSLQEAAPYFVIGSGVACIFSGGSACSIAAVVAKVSQALSILQITGMLYPMHISSIELYPELPCLRKNNYENHTVRLVVEGRFENRFDSKVIISEILSIAMGKAFPAYNSSSASSFGTKEQYDAFMSLFVGQSVNALTSTLPNNGSLDLTFFENVLYPVHSDYITFPDHINNLSTVKLGETGDYFYAVANEELDKGGTDFFQAVVTGWPVSPDEVFKSRIREVRVSTSPTFLEFNMFEKISNLNYSSFTDDSEGIIRIQDKEKDVFWLLPYEADVVDQYFDYLLSDRDGLFKTPENPTYDFVYAYPIYQIDEEIELQFHSSKGGITNSSAGSMEYAFVIFDTCGNKTFTEGENFFTWDEPNCDDPEIPCQFRNKISLYRTSFSGYEETWDVPERDPSNILEEVVYDDGTIGPDHEYWIDILKRQDAEEAEE